MRAFVLDDEPLAVRRLQRLLEETERVTVAGTSTNPKQALEAVRRACPDVLFLDIEMPGLSGFDFLEQLGPPQPLIVFTTAYDRYALDAFKVNSIDYLLKPIERAELTRALTKLERFLGEPRPDTSAVLAEVRALLTAREPQHPTRLAARVGDRVELVELSDVQYFFARDKLTFAATASKHHAVDLSISELELKLPRDRWIRIHRGTLLNVDAVKELHGSFGGRLRVRLKDGRTELQIARDRAAEVKAKLGI